MTMPALKTLSSTFGTPSEKMGPGGGGGGRYGPFRVGSHHSLWIFAFEYGTS